MKKYVISKLHGSSHSKQLFQLLNQAVVYGSKPIEYKRSCPEGLSFNPGFVRESPRGIITVTYHTQLTGEVRAKNFKEDHGDDYEWY
ncbi:hypothetical protein [Nonlabens xiamenensis]|uniref:hypothetical protein n=1 Tax=Nonlabens xiamenensis TaxID=2341043 RepID=UPI000F606B93|nr:hypothetical protein [Nonlabens xiamenensis]